MVNRFLRTAPTRTLLGTIAGLIVLVAGSAAIAVAAQGGGPVPKRERLASAVHGALGAPQVKGLSADVSFTNRLIGASELQGTDPLLQGGSGHVWVSGDGRFRLELYGDNGDPEIVVADHRWWISDPTLQTVYQGTLPAPSGQAGADRTKGHDHGVPTVSQIQTEINQLAQHLNVSGAAPTDVGGQPTYTVTLSPKQPGGLIGKLQLAWDSLEGIPLRFAVYARGDSTPVLELAASNISYGAVDPAVFNLNPPSGYRPVNVAMPPGAGTGGGAANDTTTKGRRHAKHSDVTGVKAVAKQLSFGLAAPSSLAGKPRQSVSLLGEEAHRGALLVYGEGLGAILVMEQPATASSAQQLNLSNGSGDHQRGIALPTFSVHGATAQELNTALGTFVRFTSGRVTYTVVGSVNSHTARAAARGL